MRLRNLYLILLVLTALAASCTKSNGVKKPAKKSSDTPQVAPDPSKPNASPGPAKPGDPSKPSDPNVPATPNPTNPPSSPNPSSVPVGPNVKPGKPVELVQSLRIYCRSCHAIGSLGVKFIISDNDDEVLKFLLSAQSPKKLRWLDAIVKSLEWPGGKTPPEDDKVFMPMGGKKFTIGERNFSSSESDREFMLGKLKALQKANP